MDRGLFRSCHTEGLPFACFLGRILPFGFALPSHNALFPALSLILRWTLYLIDLHLFPFVPLAVVPPPPYPHLHPLTHISRCFKSSSRWLLASSSHLTPLCSTR